IHPYSGLLSAYGMGLADIRAVRQRALEVPLDDPALLEIAEAGSLLGHEARAEVRRQGVSALSLTTQVRAHIRYGGTDTTIEVSAFSAPRVDDLHQAATAMTVEAMKTAFETAHKARFGFIDQTKSLVVEAIS